jgi:hypothetical protein
MQLVLVMAFTEQDPCQLAAVPISISVKIKPTCNSRVRKSSALHLGFVGEQSSSDWLTIAMFCIFWRQAMLGSSVELREAVGAMASGRGGFAVQAIKLSQHCLSGGGSDPFLDLDAYLVTGLPANYVAVTACLATLPQDFSTKFVLAAGSGPRIAGWDAVEAYPNISAETFQDNNVKFFKLTKHLLAQSSNAALVGLTALEGDLQAKQDLCRADMLIAAFACNALPLIDAAEAEL